MTETEPDTPPVPTSTPVESSTPTDCESSTAVELEVDCEVVWPWESPFSCWVENSREVPVDDS
ncbi:MAG: hypothetical protein QM704_27130 [Anaeromyxobacteraceae bacterium]